MRYQDKEVMCVLSDLDHTVLRCDEDGTWLHCHHPQGTQLPAIQRKNVDGISYCEGCGTTFSTYTGEVAIPVVETPGILSITIVKGGVDNE